MITLVAKNWCFAVLFLLNMIAQSAVCGVDLEIVHKLKFGDSANATLADVDDDNILDIIISGARSEPYGQLITALKGSDPNIKLFDWELVSHTGMLPAVSDINNDGKLEVVFGYDENRIRSANIIQQNWDYRLTDRIRSSPAIADLNADGASEVILCSNDGEVIAVKGDTGKMVWRYENAALATSLPAIGDLDGDGYYDVVIGCEDGNLIALEGRKGSLIWKFSTGAPVRSSPAIGDIDEDGHLEVVAGSDNGSIYAITGKSGEKKWEQALGSGTEKVVMSPITISDLDNDSQQDILLGVNGKVYAFSGHGDKIWTEELGGKIESSLLVADLDGDFSMEVFVVSTVDRKTLAYVLKGKRTSKRSVLWKRKFKGEIKSHPVMADLEGDGKIEIILCPYILRSKSSGEVRWGKFGGDSSNTGLLDNALRYAINPVVYPYKKDVCYVPWRFPSSAWKMDRMLPPAVNFADMDGDGILEIITVAETHRLLHLTGKHYNKIVVIDAEGHKKKEYKTKYDISGIPAVRRTVNGDVWLDIVAVCKNGKVYAFDGLTGKIEWEYVTGGTIESSPVLVDINGDRSMDVVIGCNDRHIYIINGRTGTLIRKYPTKGKICSTAVADDLDSDESPDLVVADDNGFVYAIDTQKWSKDWVFTVIGSPIYSPTIADIDSDGSKDVLVTDNTHIYAINGQTGKQLWKKTLPYSLSSAMSVADVNGDSNLEVLACTKKVLYAIDGRNGSEVWCQPVEPTLGTAVMVADMDDNGSPEIAIGGNDYAYIVDGNTGKPLWRYPVAKGKILGSGILDINRDGSPDLAVANLDSGSLHVLSVPSKGAVQWAKVYGDCYNNCILDSAISYAKLVDLKVSYKEISEELDRDQTVDLELSATNSGIVTARDLALYISSEDAEIPQEFKETPLDVMTPKEERLFRVPVTIPTSAKGEAIKVTAMISDPSGRKSNELIMQLRLKDINPPEIAVEHPSDGMKTSDKEERLICHVSDDRSVASVNVIVNGVSVSGDLVNIPSKEVPVDIPITLKLGDSNNLAENIIIIKALDQAGNSEEKSIKIYNGLPVLKVAYTIPQGRFQQGETVPIGLDVSNEGVVATEAIVVSISSADSRISQDIKLDVLPPKEKRSATLSPVIPVDAKGSVFKITAIAADSKGYKGNELSIELPLDDKSPPEITIEYPPDGMEIDSEQVQLKGRITDNMAISSVDIKVNGESLPPIALDPLTTDIPVDMPLILKPGDNNIRIEVSDLLDNKSEKTIVVRKAGPDLVVAQYQISDEQGNLKESIETGATVEFMVTIQNKGVGTAKNTKAELSQVTKPEGPDSGEKGMKPLVNVQIDNPLAELGDVLPGASCESLFTFSVPQSYESGSVFFQVGLSDESGYKSAKEVELQVKPVEIIRETGEARKWALLVGIDKYEDTNINPLKFAVADVMGLQELLISPLHGRFNPEDVKVLLNEEANKVNILNGLEDWLSTANENDTVLIYFSGHGVEDKGESYLLPYEADLGRVTAYAINNRDFVLVVDTIKAKKIIMIMDSCHSGGVPKGGKAVGAKPLTQDFYDHFKESKGKITFASCGPGELSYEWDQKGHGVFTYYIMEGFRGSADSNNDKAITFSELKDYVEKNVIKWARDNRKRQVPEVYMQGVTGEILLSTNMVEALKEMVLNLYNDGKLIKSERTSAFNLLKEYERTGKLPDEKKKGLEMLIEVWEDPNKDAEAFKVWIRAQR